MIMDSIRYSYGPVPSRRLGKSLGINNIPAKICTYSCVYCQVRQASQMQNERRSFYDPNDIFQDVQSRLEKVKALSEQVDYLTFVPDGEPTLDVNLGKEIELLKTLNIPVGVVTNASLISRNDVLAELGKADWVSLKIDTIREVIWQQINRPHKTIQLSSILDGILAFAKIFTGKLVTETMLIEGINDDERCIREVADFLYELNPALAYLSIPTRPPIESWVRPPKEEIINCAYNIFTDKLIQAEYLIGYEGNTFAFSGDVERDILSITAVHPMRQEAVSTFLSLAGATQDVVDRLVVQGELIKTEYNGHIFYLRRFIKTRKAAK